MDYSSLLEPSQDQHTCESLLYTLLTGFYGLTGLMIGRFRSNMVQDGRVSFLMSVCSKNFFFYHFGMLNVKRKKCNQSNYVSTITAGVGMGTSGNGYNENGDQMAK